MKFGVVWKLAVANTQDQIVMATSEAIRESENPEDAKVEGRTLMEEVSELEGCELTPLAVVEMNEHMLQDLDKCKSLSVPENPTDEEVEVTLHDVSDMDYWKSADWWPN